MNDKKMKKTKVILDTKKIGQYDNLIKQIGCLLQEGRKQTAYAVNNLLVKTYWHIGKYIVEYEQGGSHKAEYGDALLGRLSNDLTLLYGKGFSLSNLFNMRMFYIKFSKFQTLSGKFDAQESYRLSWSHYIQILKADNELEINFYTKQCEKENCNSTFSQRGSELGGRDRRIY